MSVTIHLHRPLLGIYYCYYFILSFSLIVLIDECSKCVCMQRAQVLFRKINFQVAQQQQQFAKNERNFTAYS